MYKQIHLTIVIFDRNGNDDAGKNYISVIYLHRYKILTLFIVFENYFLPGLVLYSNFLQ